MNNSKKLLSPLKEENEAEPENKKKTIKKRKFFN